MQPFVRVETNSRICRFTPIPSHERGGVEWDSHIMQFRMKTAEESSAESSADIEAMCEPIAGNSPSYMDEGALYGLAKDWGPFPLGPISDPCIQAIKGR